MKYIILSLALICFFGHNQLLYSNKYSDFQKQDSISILNKFENIQVKSEDVKIKPELANKIKIAANKWLKYYKLNIHSFIFYDQKNVDLEHHKNDTTFYSWDFVENDDIYEPQLHDYSPDKNKYMNLFSSMGVNLEDDGKYHYSGSDDSQSLFLFDRLNKWAVMFSFRGISNFADAIFWIENDTFIVAGYNSSNYLDEYFLIEIYSLKENICESYILKEKLIKQESYEIYDMKVRGIIID